MCGEGPSLLPWDCQCVSDPDKSRLQLLGLHLVTRALNRWVLHQRVLLGVTGFLVRWYCYHCIVCAHITLLQNQTRRVSMLWDFLFCFFFFNFKETERAPISWFTVWMTTVAWEDWGQNQEPKHNPGLPSWWQRANHLCHHLLLPGVYINGKLRWRARTKSGSSAPQYRMQVESLRGGHMCIPLTELDGALSEWRLSTFNC